MHNIHFACTLFTLSNIFGILSQTLFHLIRYIYIYKCGYNISIYIYITKYVSTIEVFGTLHIFGCIY